MRDLRLNKLYSTKFSVGGGAVIELLGVLGVEPPVNFSTPQLILKNYLGWSSKTPQ